MKKRQHVQVQEGLGCLLHRQSSDLKPLCQSHAYFQKERRGENRKTETFVCHQTPLGRLCFFAFQSDAAIRPRVWPWLLNAASPTRPQFKTRGWEAPSSLTRFSQFSAWLWWETYESTLCAFSKAWCVAESPSQMALCRATTAAPDSHRWRMQRRKWQRRFWAKSLYSLPVSGLEMSHVRESGGPILFLTHVSVSFWHTASHVWSLYLGARMLCFCFHLLPSQL